MKRVTTVQRTVREPRKPIPQKENDAAAALPEKKRKAEVEGKAPDVLCPANGHTEPSAQQPDDTGCWEEGKMSSEQVEALLNTKILGKSKFDLKGKNEQMGEHIKKLRSCIRHFLQVEATYVLQIEQLQAQVKEEHEKRETFEVSMNEKYQQLLADLSNVQEQCKTLEQSLHVAEEEKKALLLTHEKDMESLEASQSECQKLSSDIDKLKLDLKAVEEKIKSLQDINKRLSEYNTSLQDYNSKLQNDAASATQENAKTQREKMAILETLSAMRGSTAALQSQLDTTKIALEEESKQKSILSGELERARLELQQCSEEKHQLETQVQALIEENNRFKDFTGKSASELETVTSKAVALEESFSLQSEQIKNLHHQLDAATLKNQTLELSMEMHRKTESDQASKIAELQQRLSEAEQRLNEAEIIRRKLHNTIQELKGNIRVFCRVRPLLVEDEDGEQVQSVVQYPQFGDLVGRGIELTQAEGQKYAFSFDKVFGPDFTQANVFEEISQLVQSALDGYKVCIFAYGQTGSGKTYTMLGRPDQDEHKGLIPRSLEQIFRSSQSLESQGWKFKMQASMLEIYNETIRDLLINPKLDAQKADVGAVAKVHNIKHDNMGNTFVSDLTLVEVTSWKEVSALLRQAAQSRTVGRTNMNEQSSRSHCVFTLRISGVNESTEQQVHGILNLVDLAGSERLSKSGATGDRLKETQAINKSLACLGDVILAIANKEQHVPYRNSKLTYLLQPCLGGDSKTLMFVNIAPDCKSLHESLCSLRFAAKVNACEIGVPRRQTSRVITDASSAAAVPR
uniref:Kinesin 14-Ib protein n=1 Tax=Marsilea vestita TaxID=59764 RepID=A0A142KWC5_MARVE|nr:kinesin 14-Ib protein [Marsilea vestita]